MPNTTTIEALLTSYADAVVHDDAQALREAMATLDEQGIIQSGYVWAPLFWQGEVLIGQVAFNYTKAKTLSKRNPYTITLNEEQPNA